MTNSVELAKIQHLAKYYLSDKNLRHDEFFHDQIAKSDDGMIPVDLLLNCKPIKKLKTDKNSFIEALSTSDKLVISGDGQFFGRKDGKLPPLKS